MAIGRPNYLVSMFVIHQLDNKFFNLVLEKVFNTTQFYSLSNEDCAKYLKHMSTAVRRMRMWPDSTLMTTDNVMKATCCDMFFGRAANSADWEEERRLRSMPPVICDPRTGELGIKHLLAKHLEDQLTQDLALAVTVCHTTNLSKDGSLG